MFAKRKLYMLLAVVVTAVIGTLAGLGASGAFDSSPTEFPPMVSPPTDARAPAPNPTSAPGKTGNGLVAPDPNFREALREAGLSTRGWKTDFSRHTLPFTEILSGGPHRDGIPTIGQPKFIDFGEADRYLGRLEPVISFELNGDARA